MEYLCQVWFDGKKLDQMPPAEMKAFGREAMDYDDELKRTGRMVIARALQSTASASTVRVRNGAISTTDGPFMETKEQLGGFILIEARDLNEAIQIASGIPLARLGAIEVRPIYTIPPPQEA